MKPLLLALLALAACADPDPCDGVRDLLASPAALVLTEAEHPGWGRETCFQCHHIARIHRSECLEGAEVDLERIRALADPEDPTTCVPCHGSNGVPALAASEDDTGEGP